MIEPTKKILRVKQQVSMTAVVFVDFPTDFVLDDFGSDH